MEKLNIFENFYNDSNPDKFWKLKDTYISTPIKSKLLGYKKYIVFYMDYYVNPTIDKNTIKSTLNNFNLFVNSIENTNIKKKLMIFLFIRQIFKR